MEKFRAALLDVDPNVVVHNYLSREQATDAGFHLRVAEEYTTVSLGHSRFSNVFVMYLIFTEFRSELIFFYIVVSNFSRIHLVRLITVALL